MKLKCEVPQNSNFQCNPPAMMKEICGITANILRYMINKFMLQFEE